MRAGQKDIIEIGDLGPLGAAINFSNRRIRSDSRQSDERPTRCSRGVEARDQTLCRYRLTHFLEKRALELRLPIDRILDGFVKVTLPPRSTPPDLGYPHRDTLLRAAEQFERGGISTGENDPLLKTIIDGYTVANG